MAPLRLGFLTFVPDDGGPEGPAKALRDGIRLFEGAERLGYSTGWVRARHFERFLASPMVFLTAVAARTSRIHLGTAVIGMRYEDPIRLAEDASTADLLSGGRLELGVSSGIPAFAPILDPVFDPAGREFGPESARRRDVLLAALAGETLAHSGGGFMSIPADTDLVLTPRSAGLQERVWWGAGSLASAIDTGRRGLALHVSTLNTEETGQPFDQRQAEQIRAYRQAFDDAVGGARPSRVAAGRIVVPYLDDHDRRVHETFVTGYRSGMDAEGRPHDNRVPIRYSPIYDGSPEEIVATLGQDKATAELDELVLTLPAEGGVEAHLRLLRVVAEQIAPHLGWVPERG